MCACVYVYMCTLAQVCTCVGVGTWGEMGDGEITGYSPQITGRTEQVLFFTEMMEAADRRWLTNDTL